MSVISNQSYVTLPSETVIAHCEKKIKHITEERRKRDSKWLEKNRCNIRKYSFLGLFSFGPIIRPMTDEEMYKDLSWECTWDAYSSYAWGTLDTAEKLLRAAKMAPVVNITIEDWDEVS
jgi:hypothetical protein